MVFDCVTESSEEDDIQQGTAHGGYRVGAGRKPKYGGKTVVMRMPAEKMEEIERVVFDRSRYVELTLF
jgi:hypothetical protein